MIQYEKLEKLLVSENFESNNRDYTYNDLLLTRFWKEKRKEIIIRDKRKCNNCNSKSSIFEKTKKGEVFAFNIIEKTRGCITQDIESNLSFDDFNNISIDFIYTANPYRLHVHHRYYNLNCFPWEYDNDALICWCDKCHFAFHESNIVPVYNFDRGAKIEVIVTPCTRCHGSGFLPEFSYYKDGVCFRCMGARYEELISYSKKR